MVKTCVGGDRIPAIIYTHSKYHVRLHTEYICLQEIWQKIGNDDGKKGAMKEINFIIIIIIIIIINCNWVVTRWQWLFYMYTKYEIGY